jgi:hypothetical protein
MGILSFILNFCGSRDKKGGGVGWQNKKQGKKNDREREGWLHIGIKI